MATRLQFVERDLKLALNKQLSTEQMGKELAAFAKRSLAEILQGRDTPPGVETYVNGRKDVPEERVVLPGPILYRFNWLRPVGAFAMDWLRRTSPVLSGEYQKGHFFLHNGRETLLDQLPAGAEQLTITNDLPYARKIHVQKGSDPRYIFEECRQQVLAKYGQIVEAQVRFLDLAGAYRLKRDWGRKGRRKGDPLTYPAVVITAKQ